MTLYPTLVMNASRELNGRLSRWKVYAEPKGVPFSYTITGDGWSVHGSAGTLQHARDKVDAYYRHCTAQPLP